MGDGANDVLVPKCVDTGAVTGTIGIEAVKDVVDTTSPDDNPVITT